MILHDKNQSFLSFHEKKKKKKNKARKKVNSLQK